MSTRSLEEEPEECIFTQGLKIVFLYKQNFSLLVGGSMFKYSVLAPWVSEIVNAQSLQLFQSCNLSAENIDSLFTESLKQRLAFNIHAQRMYELTNMMRSMPPINQNIPSIDNFIIR